MQTTDDNKTDFLSWSELLLSDEGTQSRQTQSLTSSFPEGSKAWRPGRLSIF